MLYTSSIVWTVCCQITGTQSGVHYQLPNTTEHLVTFPLMGCSSKKIDSFTDYTDRFFRTFVKGSYEKSVIYWS